MNVSVKCCNVQLTVEVDGHQSTVTNTVNNRRFSCQPHNTGAGGDFVTHRWPQHQAHQHHYSHQQQQQQLQRQQTAPFIGSSSSLRHHDTAPGTAGTIPVVNGVSSGNWRQQRNLASGNAVQLVCVSCVATEFRQLVIKYHFSK